MQFSKIILSFFVLGIIISMGMTNAFGHGLGYEIMPPEMLGSKLVSLEISSDTWPDEYTKEISFALFETDTGVAVKNVTYFVMLTKQNEVLFDITSQRDDGVFVLKLHTTEDDQITVDEEDSNFFGSLLDGSKIVNVKGNVFDSGGLYDFKVIITTGNDYSNVLSPPLDYDVGISFLDKTSHSINDINFGQQKMSVITYYELINDDFTYDQNKKMVSYSMPFDWSEKNILVTSVMHQEIIIPKTFGDLMVESFSVNVNGFQVPDGVITIDDFSAENRVIHIVLNQNDILELSKKIDDSHNNMHFSIMPSAENLPLTTMTENAQFRINLSWEPQSIKSGSTTTFYFQIIDAFLLDRPVSVSYNLSIFHDGEKIAQARGISADMGLNVVEFDVPDDVTGVMTLQFENLNGSYLADAVLPVVVDRVNIDETSMPAWIKNNAGWWATDQIDDSAFLQGIQYLIQEGIMIIPPTESSDDPDATPDAGQRAQAFDQRVPAWIKNNAGWWATDQIDDSAFLQGIQYLIKEGIMVIPPAETSESPESQQVPAWIKNNAGWWADGQIDDNSFVSGIQYLIKVGIITV